MFLHKCAMRVQCTAPLVDFHFVACRRHLRL
jgi:hypothetical protein